MNYAAIDFETASGQAASAVSVAAVIVKDDEVARTFYSLIKPPPEIKFFEHCVRVNGITPEMVEIAPAFPAVWARLAPLLEGQIVLAHNAPFDMRVLADLLEYYKLPLPKFQFACTVNLSRKIWPDLPSHRLDAMGKFLQFEFNHHHALEDSLACAAIPLAAKKSVGEGDFLAMAEKISLSIADFPPPPPISKEEREAKKRLRREQRRLARKEKLPRETTTEDMADGSDAAEGEA